jgi:23S rRNA pseudouridine2605 synthase
MTEKGERIAKVMAAAGVCSRREAERLIEQGRVRVNGNTLTSPAFTVTPQDAIEVDGTTLKKRKATTLPRLWRYHKPAGLITSHHDPEGRPTVFEYLPPHLPRVISVGRLDLDSEGLLLLTDSGELSRALELPRNAMDRTYRVRVNGQISEKHIHMLSRGVVVDEVKYRPITVVPDTDKTTGRNRWLTVTLREGKNREIRRLFDYYGYPVSRLIRVGYAGLELGDLAENAVAEVPAHTVERLLGTLEESAARQAAPARRSARPNTPNRTGGKRP